MMVQIVGQMLPKVIHFSRNYQIGNVELVRIDSCNFQQKNH